MDLKEKIRLIITLIMITGVLMPVGLLSQTGMSDVPTTHWAYDAVKYLIEANILGGMPDGTYQGNTHTTRYQMAFALYRTIQFIQSGAPVTVQPGVTGTHSQEIQELRHLVESVALAAERVGQQYEQINRRLNQLNLDGTTANVDQLQQRITSLDRVVSSLSAKQLQMEPRQAQLITDVENLNNRIVSQNILIEQHTKDIQELQKKDPWNEIASMSQEIQGLKLIAQSQSQQIQELNAMKGHMDLMTWVAVGGVVLGAAGLVVGIIAMQGQGN